MKFKLFTLTVLAAAMAACTGSPARYSVQGTLTDSLATLPGSKIYVLKGNDVIDSTTVSEGKFTLGGPADRTARYGIMLNFPGRKRTEQRFVTNFVPDTLGIAIDLDYPATVTGSPLTDGLTKLDDGVMKLYYEYESRIVRLRFSGEDAQADSLEALQTKNVTDFCRETFLAHTGDIVGYEALSMMIEDLSYEELEQLLGKAAPFIAQDEGISTYAKARKAEFITGPGNPFAEITGCRADSTSVALSEFAGKGKWVLMDFWASWCAPCMNSVPNLRAIRDQYAGKGLQLIGINVHDRSFEEAVKCKEEKEMDWETIFTEGSDATDSYGVTGIPTLILIAPDGKIAERLVGEEGLAEMVAKHLD